MTQDQPSRLEPIEVTQTVHSQILNQLATAHRELTDFCVQQAQRTEHRLITTEQLAQQNSEAIAQLVIATNRNTTAIANLEEQTTRNVETMNRLEQRMDQLAELVTTSTTETIRLVADLARQQASDKAEIREIWRYLRYEPRNGNGTSEE
ncbi:MAG: hypothetical protein KME28_25145 [Pelatocladus maniniholoensis HA4357-MV3]|jgi:uncharacterized protein YgbK (DUF1537 family)|uniref:Uncharacterized protein n=1 Tax=Pelatocladus maniniholoensis HA4357-MV3 TaxID=1117104 RepID=A0A9E3LVI7_9NOST|nr:hypothetical protein [Pelatocladus maniniholoensis HA4357-MV3]